MEFVKLKSSDCANGDWCLSLIPFGIVGRLVILKDDPDHVYLAHDGDPEGRPIAEHIGAARQKMAEPGL